MKWHIESSDNKVIANLSFENGQWSQEGLSDVVWEMLTDGVTLVNGQEVVPADGIAFLQGIRRTVEPSGSQILEGSKPLSPPEDAPEYSVDELSSVDSEPQTYMRQRKHWYSSKLLQGLAAIVTIVVGILTLLNVFKKHEPTVSIKDSTIAQNTGGNVGAIYTGDRPTIIFGEAVPKGQINPQLIEVFFSEWQVHFNSGELVRPPISIKSGEQIQLRLAIQDGNLHGPRIRNVYLLFPQDTEVNSGEWAGNRWVKSNALNVSEYFYQFDNNVPKGEAQFLAPISVSFQSSGVKQIGLHITADGIDPIRRSFSLEVRN